MALSLRTILLLLMPPLCWAGNAVVARALVGQFPPLALSFLRWVLAFCFLLPFAWQGWRAQRHALKGYSGVIAWVSFLGVGVYNSFQYLALQTSPVLNVTLIAASAPIFILVIGALFFGERIYARQMLGAVVSVMGGLVVMLRGQWSHVLDLRIAAGDAWMLAAAASWAVYTWLIRRHRPAMDGVPFLAMQMALGSVCIAPFALGEAVAGASVSWSAGAVLGLLFVATFPSLVAYLCWDYGVARAGAIVPIYFANLTPLFAALLGAAVLDEPVRAYHGLGLALIVVGIHLVSRSAASQLRSS